MMKPCMNVLIAKAVFVKMFVRRMRKNISERNFLRKKVRNKYE